MLKINPNFVLELEQGATKDLAYDWFLKHEADKDLLLNVLRQAGLEREAGRVCIYRGTRRLWTKSYLPLYVTK